MSEQKFDRQILAVVMSILLLPAAAHAEPAANCAAAPAPLPAGFEGWRSKTPITSAATADMAHKTRLTLGQSANATLLPTPQISYAVNPAQRGGSVSFGGMLGFTVAQAGTYRVALGSGAWIEVVRSGKALESSAHQHGPDCSGIRKMVDFTLKPGDYLLELASSGEAVLPVMITRLP